MGMIDQFFSQISMKQTLKKTILFWNGDHKLYIMLKCKGFNAICYIFMIDIMIFCIFLFPLYCCSLPSSTPVSPLFPSTFKINSLA